MPASFHPATTHGIHTNPIKELANYTGLNERRVRMILGCHTCFAEYRYAHHRSLKPFKHALGDERYEQLTAGKPIELDRGEHTAWVAVANR